MISFDKGQGAFKMLLKVLKQSGLTKEEALRAIAETDAEMPGNILQSIKAKKIIDEIYDSEYDAFMQEGLDLFIDTCKNLKAKGQTKMENYSNILHLFGEAGLKGISVSVLKEIEPKVIEFLNELYPHDNTPLGHESVMNFAFEERKQVIEKKKAKGVSKSQAQADASKSYMDALNEGVSKESAYPTYEKWLQLIDEVYAE